MENIKEQVTVCKCSGRNIVFENVKRHFGCSKCGGGGRGFERLSCFFYLPVNITQAKGHEPMLCEALRVIAGPSFKFTYVKL